MLRQFNPNRQFSIPNKMITTTSLKSSLQNRNIFRRCLLVHCFLSGGVFRLRQSFSLSAASVLALALCLLFSGLASSFAEDSAGVVATLKSPSTVTRLNGKTGSYLGSTSL